MHRQLSEEEDARRVAAPASVAYRTSKHADSASMQKYEPVFELLRPFSVSEWQQKRYYQAHKLA
jgi:hypothetical protein